MRSELPALVGMIERGTLAEFDMLPLATEEIVLVKVIGIGVSGELGA